MSVVNYCAFELYEGEDKKLYPSDALFIEPINFLKYLTSEDKRKSRYLQCPAFTDFFKNTFLILSPIDITIRCNKKEGTLRINGPEGINQEFFDELIFDRKLDINIEHDKYLLSIIGISMTFFSEKSIEMELLPTFMAHTDSRNFNVIPGKFNIGKWIRPIEFVFEFIDDEAPVIIKRGDPLFTIRFSPDDNSKVELQRHFQLNISKYRAVASSLVAVKRFLPKLSLQQAYKLAEPIIKLFWKSFKK